MRSTDDVDRPLDRDDADADDIDDVDDVGAEELDENREDADEGFADDVRDADVPRAFRTFRPPTLVRADLSLATGAN